MILLIHWYRRNPSAIDKQAQASVCAGTDRPRMDVGSTIAAALAKVVSLPTSGPCMKRLRPLISGAAKIAFLAPTLKSTATTDWPQIGWLFRPPLDSVAVLDWPRRVLSEFGLCFQRPMRFA